MILDEMEKASRTANGQNVWDESAQIWYLRSLRERLGVMPANRFWGQWLEGLDMRDKTCKLLLGIVVRGIGHEGLNLL